MSRGGSLSGGLVDPSCCGGGVALNKVRRLHQRPADSVSYVIKRTVCSTTETRCNSCRYQSHISGAILRLLASEPRQISSTGPVPSPVNASAGRAWEYTVLYCTLDILGIVILEVWQSFTVTRSNQFIGSVCPIFAYAEIFLDFAFISVAACIVTRFSIISQRQASGTFSELRHPNHPCGSRSVAK